MPSYGHQPGDAEFPISFAAVVWTRHATESKTQCEKESQFFKIRKTQDDPLPSINWASIFDTLLSKILSQLVFEYS